MEKKFGFIPLSVLRGISRRGLSSEMFIYQQEQPTRSASAAKAMKSGAIGASASKQAKVRERLSLGLLGGVDGKKSGGDGTSRATTMPAELVAFFVKYYARPGDTYVDPFFGQGIQMQVAKMLGLNYYGYDCSKEFYAYVKAVKEKIDDGKTTISITCGDSRTPKKVPDAIGDFSFHSPPYWDIEFYGNEPEQLGAGNSYEDFLLGMEDVARAWLPKFKKGAFHVVNVNDSRRAGRFYPYHADTIKLFERAGFELYDTWIIDGLVGGLPRAFAVDFNLKRIAPKVHEYALVFRR